MVAIERAGLMACDGLPGSEHEEHYLELAQRSAGAIITAPLAIELAGRITPEDAGLYHPPAAEVWQRILTRVHEQSNARVIARLGHAGRRGSTKVRRMGLDLPLHEDGWDLLAPSAIPYLPDGRVPRAMTHDDMDGVKSAFVTATERASEAGFDALMVDMAHGYLLSSFLSPVTNQRDDEYGGAFERRLRYPLEVLGAVRAAWGLDRPLLVALNGSDRARGGLRPQDAVRIARQLRAHGCDMIAVFAGQVTPNEQYDFGRNSLAQLSDVIRNDAGVPTVATGYVDTSNVPNTLLLAGRADLCVCRFPD
jgi:anthraniloyl-CoA monooxygenase